MSRLPVRRIFMIVLFALTVSIATGINASAASTPYVFEEITFWQDPSLHGNPVFSDVQAKHVTRVTIRFDKHKFPTLKTKHDDSYLGPPGDGTRNWVAKTVRPGLYNWLNSKKAKYTVVACNHQRCINAHFHG